MPQGAWFWDRIARRYAASPVPDAASYARKIEATRARLTPVSNVLELGCGTGTTAIAHAPHVAHVDAVDFSGSMLAIARERAAAADVDNVTFHQGRVEDFAAPPGSYDMVMMHSVLHLLDDPAAAVAKAHGFLKPGGWFVSSTTATGEDGLGLVRLALMPASAFGLMPRLGALTGEGLRAMIGEAGFEIVEDWKPGPRRAIFIVARKPYEG